LSKAYSTCPFSELRLQLINPSTLPELTAIGENQLHDTVSTVSRVSDNANGAGLNHPSSGLDQVL